MVARMVEMPTRISVFGSACQIMVETGWLVWKLVPKSPCSVSLDVDPELRDVALVAARAP